MVVLLYNVLSYLKDWVFMGGCFFVVMVVDVDFKVGLVCDVVCEVLIDWYGYVEV